VKYCVLFIVFAAGACHSFRDQPISDVHTRFIPALDTAHFTMDVLRSRQSVSRFYSRRDHALKWIHPSGQLNPEGDSLIRFIEEVEMLGLAPREYHARAIADMRSDTLSPANFSRMDVLLTDAYLTLFYHLQYGRLNPVSQELVDRSSIVDLDAITSLERIPKTSIQEELWTRQPAARQYQELRVALADRLSDSPDTLKQQQAWILQLNMERWKWRKKTHDRYVSVNIPAFLMRVVEKDSVWLETPVIVGKPETPTPIMESVIRSFII
jgi:murein L,D-transpeptidase YcbB/YkuD